MKLGLVGYGKMGQAIAAIAPQYGHTISCAITSSNPLKSQDIANTDIFIDFSRPDAVIDNAKILIDAGKSIVIGTTGWDLSLLPNYNRVGIFHAANFSLGVNLFSNLVKRAADQLKSYNAAIIEEHHHHKLDAPSGTALELKRHLPENTPITSVRCGSIIGNHEIIFDSLFDQIRLSHHAKTRDAFAFGAIQAAVWLHGKQGFFSMEDLIRDQF